MSENTTNVWLILSRWRISIWPRRWCITQFDALNKNITFIFPKNLLIVSLRVQRFSLALLQSHNGSWSFHNDQWFRIFEAFNAINWWNMDVLLRFAAKISKIASLEDFLFNFRFGICFYGNFWFPMTQMRRATIAVIAKIVQQTISY